MEFKAYLFAKDYHGDQHRKYTGEPYINHPVAVARLVMEAGYSEQVVAAALLHDTIEDTSATYDIIKRRFGMFVADLVMMVTDVSKPSDGNRKVRKQLDLEHIAKASFYGKTIKLADLIDNTSSIVAHDEDFAKVYMAEKVKLLEVLKDADEYLYLKAMKIVEEYYNTHP